MEPALGRAEVSEFSVGAVSQPFVRFCIDYYWLPVLISCLLLFLVSRPNEPKSSDERLLFYLEVSFYPAILVGTALTKRLLREKIPSTVAELCQTGPLSDDVARRFARDLQQHLNSLWAESLGIAGGISIVCFYFGPGGFAGNWGPNQAVDIANVMVMCIDIMWGYLIGIAMWGVTATALDIARLARRGQLRIHPFHPDRCGGLSAIGRLYFPLALILIS